MKKISTILSLLTVFALCGCIGSVPNLTEGDISEKTDSQTLSSIEPSRSRAEAPAQFPSKSSDTQKKNTSENALQESNFVPASNDYSSEDSEKASKAPAVQSSQNVSQETRKETEKVKVKAVDPASIPDYSGKPYTVINSNQPVFPEITNLSFESYSDYDHLKRCGVAVGCIGKDLMPTEPRGSIGMIKPTGWHTVRYDFVDGKYLYNRCHLIGYQLTAENANEKNLITGTRYLNVEGMLPFENMVADYIKETNNHVMYRSTPIFEGNNLLASGVQIEGYSVEDRGMGICFNVYCYNVQPGVIINYTDGSNSLDPNSSYSQQVSREPISQVSQKPVSQVSREPISQVSKEPASQASREPISQVSQKPVPQVINTTQTYILNTNTKKFHRPGCSSVSSMKPSNKKEYSGSRDEIISMGYDPCKRCNP